MNIWYGEPIPPETEGMSWPVRCRCGQVYDLGMVEVVARYSDCSMWNTPCCRRLVDDRQWTSLPAYTEIGK